MSGLFGGGASIPPTRTEMPTPPKSEDMALTNAANAAMLRRRMAYGQSKTILTGDLGPAKVGKKTLLGE